MATEKQVLIKARKHIERGWTQGALARDAQGDTTDAQDSRAVCWCTIGAINAAAWKTDKNAYSALATFASARVERVISDACIPVWNDTPHRTKAEVLSAFDRAIAACGDS